MECLAVSAHGHGGIVTVLLKLLLLLDAVSRANAAFPTAKPTRNPTVLPTATPEPTPLYKGAPQFMYRTYHLGADCSSAVRVYDFSPLNTCIAPTEDMPYHHLEFCSVEDSGDSGAYNITQMRYVGNAALKCSGSHSFHKFDRGQLCRKRNNLWVRTQCGLPVLDAVVNREQIILSSFRTNTCSGPPMQRGVVLNGCQPVNEPELGRGKKLHSRLTYNRALSDNSTNTLFLSESFYSRKDCSGSPVKVVQVQYPKGVYTSARQRKQCLQDPLLSGFVASASYVAVLTSDPSPSPTPSPTAPSPSPTLQPSSSPTQSPTLQPTSSPTQ